MYFSKVFIKSFCCLQGIVYDNIKACVVCKEYNAGVYVFDYVIDIDQKEIGKRRGPKIDPCGTPAFICFQEEAAPGSTTL